MKVLLVDDEKAFLEQGKIFLQNKDEKFDIDTSLSAEKALKMFDKNRYDIIVSDYRMPQMDGLEFLERLRDDGHDIPFIIMTGKGEEEVAMKALNLGANRYLKKSGPPKNQFGVLAANIGREVKNYRTKKELRLSKKEKSLILNSMDEMVCLTDPEGKLIWVNEALADDIGMDGEEIEGEYCYEVWQGKEERCEACKADELFETEESFKGEVTLPDGRTWKLKQVPLFDEEGNPNGLIGIALDITERKKKEKEKEEIREKLEDAVMRFRKISEISPNAIILVDKETGQIEDINEAAEKLIGEKREKIIGSEYLKSHPEEEKEQIKKIINEGEDNELNFTQEFHISNTDNNEVPVEIGNASFKLGEKEVIYFTINDITQRKRLEERDEFLHSLLRHDLKNKIQGSKSCLQLVRDTELSGEDKELLQDSLDSLNEGVMIIEKVRKLRRIGDEENQIVELKPIIKRTLEEYESEIEKSDMALKYTLDNFSGQVKGGELLSEVFSNLILNSIKHSEGEKIVISGDKTDDEIICTIEDDGIGIPPEEREKIFGRGYSSGSSGLGLFLVKNIMETYGGDIVCKESEIGGARFDVHLQKVK